MSASPLHTCAVSRHSNTVSRHSRVGGNLDMPAPTYVMPHPPTSFPRRRESGHAIRQPFCGHVQGLVGVMVFP